MACDWADLLLYEKWKRANPDNLARALSGGLIGSPETLRRKLRKFETSNVDQIILLNHAGNNTKHQEWKRKVLSGEIELEELDTTPYTDRYGKNSVQIADPETAAAPGD